MLYIFFGRKNFFLLKKRGPGTRAPNTFCFCFPLPTHQSFPSYFTLSFWGSWSHGKHRNSPARSFSGGSECHVAHSGGGSAKPFQLHAYWATRIQSEPGSPVERPRARACAGRKCSKQEIPGEPWTRRDPGRRVPAFSSLKVSLRSGEQDFPPLDFDEFR